MMLKECVMGDGKILKSELTGSIGIFKTVHYIPELKYNLIGLNVLDKLGYSTFIKGGIMEINLEKDEKIIEKIEIKEQPQSGLYKCKVSTIRNLKHYINPEGAVVNIEDEFERKEKLDTFAEEMNNKQSLTAMEMLKILAVIADAKPNDQVKLWHYRLNHIYNKTIYEMIKIQDAEALI